MKISIVIPVFNEALTIEELLARVEAVPLDKEIIVVDDGSTDGTREILESVDSPFISVLSHAKNRGKGAALSTGFAKTTGDIVVIQDADLEYHPSEIPALVAPILDDRADVVFGSRFMGARRVFMFSHWLGNKILTLLTNLLYNTTLTDMETCYKAIRGDVARDFHLRAKGFGCEPEMTAKVFKRQLRVYEIPISYDGRTYAEGKKITWRDGLKAVYWLLRCRFTVENVGHETLRRLAVTDQYSRFLAREIAPHVGRRILEVGSGLGSISGHLAVRDLLVVSDISESYLDLLRHRLAGSRRVKVVHYDLAGGDRPDLQEMELDTIICVNVLEHVENDEAALRGLTRLLVPGGHLILLVPAHQVLYSNLDRNLDHFRRYSRARLLDLIERSGLSVERAYHLNVLGALGWWLNGRVLRRRVLPGNQLRAFSFLIPFLAMERWVRPPCGLSLMVIARHTSVTVPASSGRRHAVARGHPRNTAEVGAS
ncbi:MAG: glycosyltransferase [Acidobacteriota bacterium]